MSPAPRQACSSGISAPPDSHRPPLSPHADNQKVLVDGWVSASEGGFSLELRSRAGTRPEGILSLLVAWCVCACSCM